MNLKELPLSERPRERLRTQGSEALSTTELLAILLSTGTKKQSVVELAAAVISRFGSLESLVQASLQELTEVEGIGPAKAVQLKAALALARRALEEHREVTPFVDADQAYSLVRPLLQPMQQEALMVILKDVKGRLITCEKVSVGTLSEVLIHPREVFFPAVRHKAHSFILAHNHPSGDPTPSSADLEVTRHLLRSSLVMRIHLDDHLIVGTKSYVSLKEPKFKIFNRTS